MNILGIVVEYNPFHYGHFHHLKASQKKTDADITVAVMSGSLLQRGEPALIDKWKRTKMALTSGVDLVIELPYIYSTQKAEIFSDGAVSLLNTLEVNHLCFGSESGDITSFVNTVNAIEVREGELDTLLKENMKAGYSYPKAFSVAFRTLFQGEEILDLTKPNNILGYHYVKAIKKLSSSMQAHTILREKAGYHQKELTNQIASATAIRNEIIQKGKPLDQIDHFLPETTLHELQTHMEEIGSFAHWELYFPFLQYRILTEPTESLGKIYECEEGLEYRLKKHINQCSSFQEFMESVKTKRYTWTRLQRLFVHILMNTPKSFMEEHCHPLSPPYIRVLGMSSEGRNYLSSVKNSLPIPLITRAGESNHPVLAKDTLASHIHSLPLVKKDSLLKEYKAIPIQLEKNKLADRK
ncbi:nucleotidyltransferase [Evansella tamaricis]|uniref:tRNA(Met) cytidine acetate ligase n=1 Tax=Evansella tamaricis TaxID=2069301 RepID=A0ABS6JGQ9_9BACI|nr:nucleotidyltransferase [Evansella tamaricis]MBU9712404.1 nucleotidyltransferase [Evansella tamaricis]